VHCVSRKFLTKAGLCGSIKEVEERTSSTGQEHKQVFKEKVVLTWYAPEKKDSSAPYTTTFYLSEDVEELSGPFEVLSGPFVPLPRRPSWFHRVRAVVSGRHVSINRP